MRLLYVTAEMPYGTEEPFLIPEAKEIIRQGHTLLIVPRRPPTDVVNRDAQELRTASVAASLISLQVLASALAEYVRSPVRSTEILATVLFNFNVAAVFRNLMVFPKGLWLARLARTWKADHIHAHWASTMSTMAMVAGTVSGIPWSFTAHRGDIVSNNLLVKKTKRAAFVRFISASGVRLARTYGLVDDGDKMSVIHMGTVLPPQRRSRITVQSPANILCAAHLIPVKGHRYLLEAVRLLKQRGVGCSLAIAGAGPLAAELHALAQSLAIDDRVQFLGHVPHDDLLRLYHDGSVGVVVLPSVDLGEGLHEGIPVALIEAMAHGLPVVSTTTGGIPELLHDGAGIMVPPGDPAALADALEQLIVDSDLRGRLAATGQRRVEEDFAVEKVVSQLMARVKNQPTAGLGWQLNCQPNSGAAQAAPTRQ